MYGLIVHELNNGAKFNFFLSENDGFRVCEMVRLDMPNLYFFFDEVGSSLEEAMSDVQKKIYRNDLEHFHYGQISPNVISIFKEGKEYLFTYESKAGKDPFSVSGSADDIVKLIEAINKYLK